MEWRTLLAALAGSLLEVPLCALDDTPRSHLPLRAAFGLSSIATLCEARRGRCAGV